MVEAEKNAVQISMHHRLIWIVRCLDLMQGTTPLILACMAGHYAVVQELLSHGADVQSADTNVSNP